MLTSLVSYKLSILNDEKEVLVPHFCRVIDPYFKSSTIVTKSWMFSIWLNWFRLRQKGHLFAIRRVQTGNLILQMSVEKFRWSHDTRKKCFDPVTITRWPSIVWIEIEGLFWRVDWLVGAWLRRGERPTSSLARFLSSALPLLALRVIIASCPTRVKLHVQLPLFAR